MGKEGNSSTKNERENIEINGHPNNRGAEIENQLNEQANTIARLENEIRKQGDPNATPKIIQKGSQVHPKYQRNNNKIAATIPKVKK